MHAKEKHALRARAHQLKAFVTLGAGGLTEAVVAETDLALDHHELVKVRLAADDRKRKNQVANELCNRTGAELVQLIGHVAVLYRRHTD
ncbi:MAG: ribosome assembly RNA-binding protein YhbY [Gammaproteobacteria bacterium]|nr:ribosome assembly RNA-binding protein YhbY [Gammaproteobacteria bacterium]